MFIVRLRQIVIRSVRSDMSKTVLCTPMERQSVMYRMAINILLLRSKDR